MKKIIVRSPQQGQLLHGIHGLVVATLLVFSINLGFALDSPELREPFMMSSMTLLSQMWEKASRSKNSSKADSDDSSNQLKENLGSK